MPIKPTRAELLAENDSLRLQLRESVREAFREATKRRDLERVIVLARREFRASNHIGARDHLLRVFINEGNYPQERSI